MKSPSLSPRLSSAVQLFEDMLDDELQPEEFLAGTDLDHVMNSSMSVAMRSLMIGIAIADADIHAARLLLVEYERLFREDESPRTPIPTMAIFAVIAGKILRGEID